MKNDPKTKLGAFIIGVAEFRQCVTWADPGRSFPTEYTALDRAYDLGREFAHKLTRRGFEE